MVGSRNRGSFLEMHGQKSKREEPLRLFVRPLALTRGTKVMLYHSNDSPSSQAKAFAQSGASPLRLAQGQGALKRLRHPRPGEDRRHFPPADGLPSPKRADPARHGA